MKWKVYSKKLPYEQVLDILNVWRELSSDDFFISPNFLFPIYDLYRDEFVEMQGVFKEDELVALVLFREDDVLKFGIFEQLTPYTDFVANNSFRKEAIGILLEGRKFELYPIPESSPTVKLLREMYGIEPKVHGRITFVNLPKDPDKFLYSLKQRDKLVKLIRKLDRKVKFEVRTSFNFYDVLTGAKLYLLPSYQQVFINELLMFNAGKDSLRIFVCDERIYVIVFLYSRKAYIWHVGGIEYADDLETYAMLKSFMHLIHEGISQIWIPKELEGSIHFKLKLNPLRTLLFTNVSI